MHISGRAPRTELCQFHKEDVLEPLWLAVAKPVSGRLENARRKKPEMS